MDHSANHRFRRLEVENLNLHDKRFVCLPDNSSSNQNQGFICKSQSFIIDFLDNENALFNDKEPNKDLRSRDRTMDMRPNYVEGLKRITHKSNMSISPRKAIQSAKVGGRPKIVCLETSDHSLLDARKISDALKPFGIPLNTTAATTVSSKFEKSTTPAGSKVSKVSELFGSKAHSINPNSLAQPIDINQDLRF